MKFLETLNIDGYGVGPQIVEDNGRDVIVDFKNSLLGACEACQTYHEQVYRWDGKKFLVEKDRLDEAWEEYNKIYDDTDGKPRHVKNALGIYESYLNSYPENFAAMANCAYIYDQLGQKDKEKEFDQRLLKLGNTKTADCPHCTFEMLKWVTRNQQMVLDRIADN
jgi:hypothetical protein